MLSTKSARPAARVPTQLKREISELEASGAASEQVYSKRKELLEQEKLDLIAKQAFLYDDAEAQKDIAQQTA
jgi:hypothetical protein